jgi:phosphotransferase system enzyme I (PtsI)
MAALRLKSEIVLQGIGVSPGVVVGPAFIMVTQASQVVEKVIAESEVGQEISRFEDALIETRRQIRQIQKDLENHADASDSSILDAHLMVLDDRMLLEDVITEVRSKKRNAESIVKKVADRFAAKFASIEDDYLRERVVDIKDVARRLIRNLQGDFKSSLSELTHRVIVVAADLEPSETASLRREMVSGFVTDMGSPTAHTAVMARALQIPAIVGLRNVTDKVMAGDEMLMDGNKGILIIHPTRERLEEYGKVAQQRQTIQHKLTELTDKPAETTDGHRLVLSANTEGPEELDSILEFGAEGVGLFRSEFLFMSKGRTISEDEQCEAYSLVASRLAPASVIIRTLDLGGDKYFPNAERFHEANPFLGCRSIRLSLLYPQEFKSQIRAIMKANKHGNVKIMYPMISGVNEVIRANELLEEAKQELLERGIDFKPEIDVGAMIEIPSAALTADAIAEHVDFLSIGTNDLCQYTLAVDRVNERVAYLYQPTHPAVIKLIKETVDAGHRHKIWVGICGEMAADPLMTPLLVGLGLDEFSVAPAAVPMVKDAIRSVTFARCRELAETVLACKSASEVLNHCRKLTREVTPELLELV